MEESGRSHSANSLSPTQAGLPLFQTKAVPVFVPIVMGHVGLEMGVHRKY